jgi:diacylglycerol kinase family enzyme
MPKLTLAALAATVETLTAELARAHARIDVLRKTAEQHHATLANIVTAGLTPEVTARAKATPKRGPAELAEWRAALAELREEAGKPTGWFAADVVRERIAARATLRENTAAAA